MLATLARRTAPAVAAVALLALAAPAPAAAQLLDWRAKVDSTVLGQAALGETELLVYLAEQADLSGAYDLATKEEKGRYVYERLTAVADATQAGLLAELDLLGAAHRPFWIVNAMWVRGGLAVVEAVARHPEVARVHAVGFGGLDTPVAAGSTTAAGAEASAADPAEWNVEIVGAPEAWALGYTGQGVVVAGADTGVFWEHEALKGRYRGWDGATASHDYNWHDAIHNPNPGCPASSPEPCDDDVLLGGGHGTHTVGTVVGDGGPGNRIGLAPGAQWIACRNMNNGLGAVPTYLECMEWFLAPTDGTGQNPDPARAPHVINNSWGCVEACPPPVLKAQLEASRAAGIVYVVSAGNDGSQCSSLIFPLAIYEGAFSVGATDRNDGIAGFSSRGPILTDVPNLPRRGPDISAPGVGVRSALRNGGYGALSGTSMAGPHVAGLVALLISADPDLAGDVERIEEIVTASAVGLTTTQGCGDDTPESVPNNSFGWGRIDALAAVELALGDGGGGEPTCTEEETITFFDDLEPGPEAGWSVDTAANASPASLPWTLAPDPFARSPQQSFTGDATTLDLKDDRLVSPPLAVTPASRLVFWHRFDFESGFDGGVLEVSTDGGATWTDVLAGGGAFAAGGYTGTISPDFGSPVAGRPAWTGASGSADAMVRSAVDLGAFAEAGAGSVRVRWRLAADPLAPGALPGLAWWIDDVSVVEVTEVCPGAPVAEDDAATTSRDTPVAIDVLANDSDPDGDPLTVASVADPANGSARIEPDQAVTYTPDPGFVGTDSFDYEACDPGGLCDSATVTVTVEDRAAEGSRVSGGGSINTGSGDEGRFNLSARSGAAGAAGRVSYRSGALSVKGTVEALAFPAAGEAALSGSCELGDGTPCRFEASAADGGEPGAGRDRFAIRVTDESGAVVHEAAGFLTTGNVQVE
jgi:subtilisin family serine protease